MFLNYGAVQPDIVPIPSVFYILFVVGLVCMGLLIGVHIRGPFFLSVVFRAE